MKKSRSLKPLVLLAAIALAMEFGDRTAHAYIRLSYSLGRIMNDSAQVTAFRVTDVDRGKNIIVFRKVRDIKGKSADETLRHAIGNNGEFNQVGKGNPGQYIGNSARDWRDIMEWAEIGKDAVIFCSPNGTQAEICLGNYWYQAWKEAGGWRMIHAEPTFSLAYAGQAATLIKATESMQAGQEVVIPCMAQSDVSQLLDRSARLQRVKASLKIQDYNPTRDFVSWGGDSAELRPLVGMPGFSLYEALPTMGPGPVGVTPADFTGDGKPDFCLYSGQRIVLMENKDGVFAEFFAGIDGGARTAAWADYNGDGRQDLLLVTPSGLRLLANQGDKFVDCSTNLPPYPYPHITAAAWIGGTTNTRPDLLLADGFRGLRFLRNKTPRASASNATQQAVFEDVSDAVGLGTAGAAGKLKGDHLALADVNDDGRTDILFSAGTGVLILNTPAGFKEAPLSGIRYQSGGITPAFGDFNSDGRPDLFVPQREGVGRLFLNDGAGRFRDVTALSGALASAAAGQATCAIWTDFSGHGRLDLLVGCIYGPNRYFRNCGDGTFTDAGDELGLYQKIYNSSGMCALDMNRDGVQDLVLANTVNESSVLVGSKARLARTEITPTRTLAKK